MTLWFHFFYCTMLICTNYKILQGSMVPVLQCLQNLKAHFVYNAARENIRGCSRKRWDQPVLTSFEETDSRLKDASNFQSAVDGYVESGIKIHWIIPQFQFINWILILFQRSHVINVSDPNIFMLLLLFQRLSCCCCFYSKHFYVICYIILLFSLSRWNCFPRSSWIQIQWTVEVEARTSRGYFRCKT